MKKSKKPVKPPMKAKEALVILQSICDGGYGDYPISIHVVVGGITYADDAHICLAEEYDGKRVWIYGTDRFKHQHTIFDSGSLAL